jgi:hypothetical protein
MKRKGIFVASAILTFTLMLASGAKANWFFNASAASKCKAIGGVPTTGWFGELSTVANSGPVGDTWFGRYACLYDDPVTDISTGKLLSQIDNVDVSVYDGDYTYDAYHTYDFKAALCLQTFQATYWWCGANHYPHTPDNLPVTYGWGDITFSGTAVSGNIQGDLLPVLNGKGWATPWLGASKIVWVAQPANSTFYGWELHNTAPYGP